MKNALSYYYGLDVSNIHQRDKTFYFQYKNIEYILTIYEENDINKIYETALKLNQMGIYSHQIISNKLGSLLTKINDENYVLMKMYTMKKEIQFNDIIEFNNIPYKETLKVPDWYTLWTNKVDYFEYQISQIGKKHLIVRSSFSYYIGLSENAISLINNINKDKLYYSLTHKRINCKYSLQDLYNPLNFVTDLRIRDVCEYFKSCFFNKIDVNNLTIQYLYYNKLNYEESICFMARMLFPTYYFDIYEKIINNEIDEDKLYNIINLVNEYEDYLKNIYHYLLNSVNIPNIEWLN